VTPPKGWFTGSVCGYVERPGPSDYVDGTGASGEKCNECLGKQRNNECTAG